MTASNAQALRIERIFDAPVEKVWKAWSDPEEAKKWWGSKNFTTPTVNIDFRIGGKTLFCMRGKPSLDAPEQDFWSTGTYKEIVPLKKIVTSDSFADDQGNVVPASHYGMVGDFPMELEIIITFKVLKGGKTKMILAHVGMPEGENPAGAMQGWNESFDKLATILTQ